MNFLTMQQKINEFRKLKAQIYQGGGQEKIKKQHEKGKLTARERLALLLDKDSFQETGAFVKHRCKDFGMEKKFLPADGVVCGAGTVNGKLVFVASQDFTVAGGSVGEAHAAKICDTQDSALKCGAPFIFINDSGGARIQEGVNSLHGYGQIFYRNVLLSGVVPQISIIAGPCAGGAAYSPALTDFIIQVKHSQMFITGPKVIKQVTGEEVTSEALGGVEAQMHYAGVVHFIAETDEHAIEITKQLLSFLPSNNLEEPEIAYNLSKELVVFDETLNHIIPDNPKEPYDMKEVIYRIVDDSYFLEVQEGFAQNIIIGFGRFAGKPVGIVANQPKYFAGVLDINSSDKAARFIRFCNAFNIPIVTLVDVPGFLPGVKQEYGGIIRHGAKMLFVYSAATVPKITVILRKAYGGAFLAMCAKDLGADRCAAWPSAEIAVMGAEGAVDVVFRREIKNATDPQEKRKEFINFYREKFSSPYQAASLGLIDDIIEPAETRKFIIQSLEILKNKRGHRPPKKHGLMPL